MYLFFGAASTLLPYLYINTTTSTSTPPPPTTPPASTMSLLPPPKAIYPDPTTAFTAIQAHARQHGYAFIKFNKKPSRLLFAYDRAGNYDPRGKVLTIDKSKQRENTSSKKCRCLIRVELYLDRLSNQWILRTL